VDGDDKVCGVDRSILDYRGKAVSTTNLIRHVTSTVTTKESEILRRISWCEYSWVRSVWADWGWSSQWEDSEVVKSCRRRMSVFCQCRGLFRQSRQSRSLGPGLGLIRLQSLIY
jgi:hypothetical protein